MRFLIVVCAIVAVAGVAVAQNPLALVTVEPPATGFLVVTHPTLPALVFDPTGAPWDPPFDVRIGHAISEWGICIFMDPLLEAEALVMVPHTSTSGLVVLDSPLPLDGPPSAVDGWTTVSFQHLRGGGHSDGPVLLHATMPGYDGCPMDDRVALTLRSPDINGDLLVNLTDIVLFVPTFDDYQAWADFWPDGVINLSDMVIMAQAL